MLSRKYEIFLNILNCGIHGRPYALSDEDAEYISETAVTAESHQVLPIIAEAVWQNSGIRKKHRRLFSKALNAVVSQTVRTAEFTDIYRQLYENGTEPVIFKGIILDSLYPKKNYRITADADVLIKPEQAEAVHQILTGYGLEPVDKSADILEVYETAYTDPDTKLYIEIHRQFFPSDSDAYSNLNRYFTDVYNRKIQKTIYGMPVYTLEYTDHFFYLICHTFKHFLYSGFGIRQVCDIILYADEYADRIDWIRMRKNCEETNTFDFIKAILKIGDRYLYPENKAKAYIADWHTEDIDEEPLLEDILEGGLYGASTMNRLHSSNMTLTAVANDKNSQKKNPLLSSVFLPLESMEGRYPYLKKAPYLLPAAWMQRIGRYGTEVLKGNRKNNSTKETVITGNKRIELLKLYNIIR